MSYIITNKEDIIKLAENFINNNPSNHISKEAAIHPSCAGMQIYDAPIFAFGCADDALYTTYKSADIIGSHFLSPTQWLPSAKTVISFFLPYTGTIKAANAADNRWPANEWLHGRYQGQQLLVLLMEYLVDALSQAGFSALAPGLDQRFKTGDGSGNRFSSNWSERHVAYACGLGTFALSRGVITKKGICGRFGSVLTSLALPADTRDYDDIYEYCNMCGLCISRCPAGAISFEEGMQHSLCGGFVDETGVKHGPMYGCGKCQTGVPCESGIPVGK